MAASYAATFDVAQPEKFDRVQVALRLAIVIVLSIVAGAIGWLQGLIYLGIPVLAAVMISQRGAQKYLDESDQNTAQWLRFIMGLYAYLFLLTDKLPDAQGGGARFAVKPNGTPTVGSALLRIIMVIPHAIVLVLLGIVAGIMLLIAAIMILIQETYPAGIYDFLRGYIRWHARVLAYSASLVDEYPPFAFDTGADTDVPALPPGEGQPR